MEKKSFFNSSDLYAVVVAALFLVVGGIIAYGYLNAQAELTTKSFVIKYPAGWLPATGSYTRGKAYRIENIRSQSSFRDMLRIAVEKYGIKDKNSKIKLNPVLDYMMRMQKQFPMYRQFSMKKFKGSSGVQFGFAYVYDPVSPSRPAALPVVVQGVCRIMVDIKGKRLFAVSYACDQKLFQEQHPAAISLLDSFSVK